MKKILYIGGFQLPYKNAAAHRVVANSKLFVELGADVLLVGQDSDLEEDEVIKEVNSNLDNIKMFSIPYPKGTKQWLQYITDVNRIKKAIKDNNIDTLVLYNYPSFASLRLLPFLKKRNIKVIADCTEWYGVPEGSFIKKAIKQIDTYLRMKVLNPKLDGLIVISKFLYNYYNKTHRVYLPPLVDLKSTKFSNLRSSLHPKDIHFLYGGQMGTKDRINNVLKILSELRKEGIGNFKFDVIGVTVEDFLAKNTIDYEYEDFVTFWGRLPHHDVIKMTALADFVVFLRENTRTNNAGFPTKFVEAISCGTPVITNSTSNISDFLKENYNGFFIDGDEDEIKNKFRTILSLSKEQISELKNNCKSSSIFDYRNYIKEVDDFLLKFK